MVKKYELKRLEGTQVTIDADFTRNSEGKEANHWNSRMYDAINTAK